MVVVVVVGLPGPCLWIRGWFRVDGPTETQESSYTPRTGPKVEKRGTLAKDKDTKAV